MVGFHTLHKIWAKVRQGDIFVHFNIQRLLKNISPPEGSYCYYYYYYYYAKPVRMGEFEYRMIINECATFLNFDVPPESSFWA